MPPVELPPPPPKRADAVRIGLIGLNDRIGAKHLTELERNPHFRLVAGCDIRLEDARVVKQVARVQAAGGKVYRDYRELLGDPQVEAVSIVTPHFLHHEMIVAAFKAGKHVLVEKPLAIHPDHVAEILELHRATKLVGAVQMQHVGRLSFLKLRQALAEGAIGTVREVFLSSQWWRPEEYFVRNGWAGRRMANGLWNLDGVLFNQSIHDIHQALALLAPGPLPAIANVSGMRAAMYNFHQTPTAEMEDTVFLTGTLEVPQRPRLHLAATTCSKVDRHVLEVLGDRGRAMWNGAGFLFLPGQPAVDFSDDSGLFEGTSRIFDSFFAAIRTGSRPMTDFSELAKLTLFMHQVYAAAGSIRRGPWEAHETMPTILQDCHAARCLPGELVHPPAWA